MKIKICGLSRIEDICCVNIYKPDYIGFVFAASKRQIDEETARILKALLDPSIKAIGVFVNANAESIVRLAKGGIIDGAQLHGDEDEDFIKALKSKIDIPLIKAIRVSSKERLNQELKIISKLPVDQVLLDCYNYEEYGGSGKRFNWDYLDEIDIPYFLAGGICLENLGDALAKAPYAIDLSSGVESKGLKDIKKIKAVIEKVRA